MLVEMGRGPSLTNQERGQILAFHQLGKSNREIASIIGRSHDVIDRFLKKSNWLRNKKSPGRPRSLDNRQIQDDYALPVSRITLSNELKRGGTIVVRQMKKGPQLQAHHKVARLQFAQNHIGQQTNWSEVIWSDEKRFCPDRYNSYFHDLRKDPLVFSKRGFGGSTLMVWAAFCADGEVSLEFITPKMNSLQYQGVLGTKLLPFLNTAGRQGYVFQHDNASVHVSRSTTQWLATSNVRVLDWPACSPDLNPIENLWGVLTRKLYAGGKKYANAQELIKAIQHEWQSMDLGMLRKMSTSIPNRLIQVIQRQGAQTDY